MNLASMVVVCIVMGLGIVSVIRAGKSSASKCDGNCSGCMVSCRENKEKIAITAEYRGYKK